MNDRTIISDLAADIRQRSIARWGKERETILVGRHPTLQNALTKLVRYARSESPVLITGETGTGKELFARALHLASRRRSKEFLCVNCARYAGEQPIVSELFGHRRGSFTGAVADQRGVFEDADAGIVFLDEIAELPPKAQAMLLRTLSEGEIVAVGSTRPKRVNVRVIAATGRDLDQMVADGRFREDLYYRLCYLRLHVPPLRERGEDWELIASHYLVRLCEESQEQKRLSSDVIRTLSSYPWPGNVRQVRSCVETGFYMSDGPLITLQDVGDVLEGSARVQQLRRIPFLGSTEYFLRRMVDEGQSFWDVIHQPFIERDLNRNQVRQLIAEGLKRSGGSYKRLINLLGIAQDDYLKFMDFLRHQRLKPDPTAHIH